MVLVSFCNGMGGTGKQSISVFYSNKVIFCSKFWPTENSPSLLRVYSHCRILAIEVRVLTHILPSAREGMEKVVNHAEKSVFTSEMTYMLFLFTFHAT